MRLRRCDFIAVTLADRYDLPFHLHVPEAARDRAIAAIARWVRTRSHRVRPD